MPILCVCMQDPDAPMRQQRKLSELDIKDELALNKHLFTCLRAGQFDKVRVGATTSSS